MKRRFTILTAALALLVSLAIPMGVWGQTTIYSQDGGGTVEGWTFQNNVTTNNINQNSYWLLDAGNPSDYIITLSYDLSSYSTANLSLDAATYGSGGSPLAVVQISFDGGSTFNNISLTGTQPTDKNYKTLTATITSGLTNNVVIKYSNGVTSGRGLRLQNLVLTASSGGGTQPETYTVTYDANGGTGTMTDSYSPYEENATVTLLSNSFTAPEGKIWDSWLVKDASNNTLTVTNNQFTMPASNVTVSAQWKENTTPTPGGDNIIIDFEDNQLPSGWTNTNSMTVVQNPIDNSATTNGSYCLSTNGKQSCSLTSGLINNIVSISIDATRTTNNTVTNLYIDFSTTNNFTESTTQTLNVTNIPKSEWAKSTLTLSEVASGYVRIRWAGNSTATKFIDNIVVTQDTAPFITANDVNIAYDATSSSIAYTITYGVEGGAVTSAVVTASDPENWLTVNGSNPYTSPITLSCAANTTSNEKTATVTLTYTYNTNETVTKDVTVTQTAAPYTTIPALFEAATPTSTPVTVSFGNWVVTGVNGGQSFVTDGTNGFIMYQKNHGFEVGDILSGTVNCDLVLFNESAEITGLTISSEGLTVAKNGSVTPVVTTINTLQAVNTGSVVTLKNLTYNGEELTDENNNTIVYYTSLYDGTTLETGKKYNVTGVFVWFNSTRRILPRSAADIEQIFTLTIPAFNSQNGGYRLISSPIGTVDPENVTNMLTRKDGDNNTYDLYRFDQAEELEWQNYRYNNFANAFDLTVGHGYLYGNLSDVELVFTGTAITSGTQNVTLDYTEGAEFVGWNLVGNPFGVEAYIDRPFYRMNTSGQINGTTETGSIGVMEGVFVIATNEEQMPFSTQPIVKKGSTLALNLNSSHTVLDRAIVRFDEGQQLPKFQLNKNHTKVYFTMDGKDYAIVRSEEMGAMPVNFKAEDNGTYSLNFNSENVEFSYLHLIDNMTGNDIDLLKTPSYSFEAKTTDYESRFKLVFATGDNSNDDTFAFYSNGSFVINNEGNAELQVIDITGRIVKSESVNGCTNVNVNAIPGVYMLRLVNGDNVKVQKVVVK